MESKAVFRSSRVVVGRDVKPASIHVENGVIARIEGPFDVPPHWPIIDAGSRVIMPGIVDSHVHVNEPGRTQWEGFETATCAAAAGGLTTIIDMPLNSIPPTTSVKNLRIKRMAAEGKCHVDVGFWGGVVPGNARELAAMLDAGALGFKCFMVDSGVSEFPCVADADLKEALAELAGTGAPLLCHAELAGPIDAAKAGIALSDIRKYSTWLRSRPPEAEEQAIELLVKLCRATGARVHVVHLSAASAIPLLQRAKEEGLPISAETTPHYLHFAAEDVPDGATAFKCAPPIRERENRERLWEGLARGTIEAVVSDHSPCSPALKQLEAGNFHEAWGGIASLELGLPITWTDARKRGASLNDLARWLCQGPARLAGLEKRKGSIAPGCDADLVIWDPDATFKVDAQRIHHRHKLTPYSGEELQGVVFATYVRGNKVFQAGEIGSPQGRFLQ